MFQNYPDVVNVNQLAEMLDIGIVLAYKLVKSNDIKSRKIGREYKILRTEVIRFLNDSINSEV